MRDPLWSRSKTLSVRGHLHLPLYDEDTSYPEGVERPKTRGDCKDAARPCPFVSCRHHLLLEVRANGGITLNYATVEVEELPHTCSLDLADRGGLSLEEVGQVMRITRERVRQLQEKGVQRLSKYPLFRSLEREGYFEPEGIE
jgi:hypothetical protein